MLLLKENSTYGYITCVVDLSSEKKFDPKPEMKWNEKFMQLTVSSE